MKRNLIDVDSNLNSGRDRDKIFMKNGKLVKIIVRNNNKPVIL